MGGEPTDLAPCAAAEQWLNRFVSRRGAAAHGREHLAGRFSLADIALGCTIELLPALGYTLAPDPHVRAWLEHLQARDSWRSTSMGAVKPAGTSTSERSTNAYGGGVAPAWEIGQARRDLVAAFDERAVSGSVLDLGCGTGDNVLALARRGLDAWGLDSMAAAIAAAENKRAARGLAATCMTADALDLAALGRTFDTVLDCGLFHVLEDEERRRYVRALAHVLRPGGRHLMLGFITNTRGSGPRGYSPGSSGRTSRRATARSSSGRCARRA